MKLLIVGASGLVGGNFLHVAQGLGHEAVGTYASYPLPGLIPLQIEDTSAIQHLLETFAPQAVIACTAWSWVDGCQSDPQRAFLENAQRPAQLARLADQHGAAFLYFSTSYVFDGIDGPYPEDAPTHPLSVYGQSKLEGERLILQATSGKALIARTMGVYGEEPQQKNFVYQVVKSLRAGRPLTLPSDQRGNASYAPDLALMSLSLLEKKQSGIWNVAGPDPNLYRKDFAQRIAEAYELDALLLRFSTTAELKQPAPRPLGGGLLIDRVLKETGLQPSPWTPVPIPHPA